MAELWRTVLFPVFVEKRYPGRYFRLLEGISAIQRGHHTDAFLGAYQLAKLTGLDVGDVKKFLKRLVADEVLQIVEWGRPGRFKGQERYGAPGIAHKYALGLATYPLFVQKGAETPPIERGSGHPHTGPGKGAETPPIERGSGHPLNSSGIAYAIPSSEKDALPATPNGTGRHPGLAALSLDLITNGGAPRPPEVGAIDDDELRRRVLARRRR